MILKIKQCSTCKQIKPVEEFCKRKDRKSGIMSRCKECMNEIRREYYKNNPEKRKEIDASWNKNNPEKRKENSKKYYKSNAEKVNEGHKEYRKNNSEKLKECYREWKNNNPEKVKEKWKKQNEKRMLNPTFHLSSIISRSIRQALKKSKNNNHWEDLLGYTIQDLRVYLESKFKEGMSWENQGKWHIDHIIPKSLFKYESHADHEFKECWALTNLQPLWWWENLSKGNRLKIGGSE